MERCPYDSLTIMTVVSFVVLAVGLAIGLALGN
jgi:hypothetical protein